MYSREPISLKLIWNWCLIFLSGLVMAYLGFIALVSIWVGLGHIDQPGSWVPIFIGTLFFIALITFFIRVLRRMLGRLRSTPAVTISPNSPSSH